ncbi:GGDEF domain-containing protein [Sphingosinicella soli]|uniref:GGDEF domain-containing protein n=1 Tax=Sphingosinicella soli TaxID=333708 RepID=UPI001FB195DA|nr:GGDEF domain-containing protein [Sphingosinicella soli]
MQTDHAVFDKPPCGRGGPYVFIKAESARVNGTAFSIALLDVDHFKSVNDRFGHDVGDAVLRHVGALAMAIVGRQGLVGRLGGEEFAVLMPGRSLDQAAGLCARRRAESRRCSHVSCQNKRPRPCRNRPLRHNFIRLRHAAFLTFGREAPKAPRRAFP